MKKPYKVLLVIILSAALLHLFYFSIRSPVRQYDTAGRIVDDCDNKTQPDKITITGKKRVSFLLLGIERGARADTIIFISYDSAESKLSLISIPRDTYFHEAGYNRGDQRKINAVYGRSKEKGCVDAVGKVLCDTNIDYYVSIDYEGVEKIVDAIGGIEIEVPLEMRVGGITIAEGRQVLNGLEALHYMRFRKEYPDGDLGRIKAQQKLIKSALSKIKYSDLPRVISTAFNSIRTNIPLKYINEYAGWFISNGAKDVSVHILPGVAMYKYIDGYNWSYFFHSSKEVKELMDNIFEIESIEQKKRKRCQPD